MRQDHLHTVLLTMSGCEYVSQLLARISEAGRDIVEMAAGRARMNKRLDAVRG